MRWKYLLKFYAKQLLKSKLYLIAFSTAFILVFYTLYTDLSTPYIGVYGQITAPLYTIVQLISFLYLIFFYRVFSNELSFGIQHIFVDGFKIMIEKMTALITIHLFIQLFTSIAIYLIYVIVFTTVDVPISIFYISLLRFIVVYFLFPCILPVLWGVLTAILFGRKKVALVFLLIIWIFTGVLNQEIFRDFFSHISTNSPLSLLSIGPPNIDLVYQSYKGFNYDAGNELTLLTWISILSIFILLSSLKWSTINREIRFTYVIIIFLLIIAGGGGWGVTQLSKNIFNYSAWDLEEEYYHNLLNPSVDLNYQINDYQIDIVNNKVDATMGFHQTGTATPTFQLYHKYPINFVLVDNASVSYEREGDILRVLGDTDKFETITISYQLVDSSSITYSDRTATLLANYAWYPKKKSSHMYNSESNPYTSIPYLKISDDLFVTETYDFRVKADNILFTNLNQVGDYYEGNSQAVTLLRGEGNQFIYKDYEITYPADWPNMEDQIEEVISHWDLIFLELQKIVEEQQLKIPNKIVFTNIGLYNAYLTNDHLIYQKDGFEALTDFNVTKDFENQLIELAIPQKGRNFLFLEWSNFTSQFIREQLQLDIDLPGVSVQVRGENTEVEEVVDKIFNNFSLLDTERKREFLYLWYSDMNESWNWDDVVSLMEDVREN